MLIKIDGSLRIKLVSGNHWDINKKEEKKESKIISKEVRFNEIKKISRRNKTLKKEPLFSEKVLTFNFDNLYFLLTIDRNLHPLIHQKIM